MRSIEALTCPNCGGPTGEFQTKYLECRYCGSMLFNKDGKLSERTALGQSVDWRLVSSGATYAIYEDFAPYGVSRYETSRPQRPDSGNRQR